MSKAPWLRPAALFIAIAGWAALILQFILLAGQMMPVGDSLGAVIWRYFGFFTIIANIFTAIVTTTMAVAPAHRLARSRARLSAVVAITLVGLVYSIALRKVWNPQGWQAVADHLLHDVVPPLFLLLWCFANHGRLKVPDALWALALPVAYCAYLLARGAISGWYPYWFLDPAMVYPLQMAANLAMLLAAVAGLATGFVLADRLIDRRRRRNAAVRPVAF